MNSDVAVTSNSAAARAPRNRRIRLSRGRYKATLVTHIVSAGAWIGIDVSLTTLILATVLAVVKPWGRIRRRAGTGPRSQEEER